MSIVIVIRVECFEEHKCVGEACSNLIVEERAPYCCIDDWRSSIFLTHLAFLVVDSESFLATMASRCSLLVWTKIGWGLERALTVTLRSGNKKKGKSTIRNEEKMHSISRAASALEKTKESWQISNKKNKLETHLENQIEMLQQKNQLREQFRLGEKYSQQTQAGSEDHNPPNWEAQLPMSVKIVKILGLHTIKRCYQTVLWRCRFKYTTSCTVIEWPRGIKECPLGFK